MSWFVYPKTHTSLKGVTTSWENFVLTLVAIKTNKLQIKNFQVLQENASNFSREIL